MVAVTDFRPLNLAAQRLGQFVHIFNDPGIFIRCSNFFYVVLQLLGQLRRGGIAFRHEFGAGDNFHSYSITGGEPLIHYEFVKELAGILKNKSKAKLFLETSGLITKYFKELDDIFDIMSIDIKTHSEKVLKNLPVLLETVNSLKHTDYYLKLLLPEDNAKAIIDYTALELHKYNIKNIIIQPVDSIITKDTIDYLYNMYYSKNIEARIIPQTHKILAIP